MRAILYDRTSVRDDSSMEEHLRRARAFADARGWTVVAEETDRGISGYRDVARPGWARVRAAVDGGEVDAVIVFAVSRAARSVVRLFDFVEACRAAGVTFASATEPIDTSGEFGLVFVAILAALAEVESATKSERAKVGRATAERNGTWAGSPVPFGWVPVAGKLVPNPVEAEAIRRAAGLIIGGASLRSALADLNSSGVRTRPMIRSTLRRVLGNPANRGTILTRRDFDRVADVLAARTRASVPAGRKFDRYLLTGLLTCGRCGGGMSGRGGSYICQATGSMHLRIGARETANFVVDAADGRPVPAIGPAVDPATLSAPLLAKRDELERRLEDAGARFADGEISESAFRGLDRRLATRLTDVDRELEAVAAAVPPSPLRDWLRRGAPVPDPADRTWLETVIDRIVIQPAGSGVNRFDPTRIKITWR